MDTDNKLRIEEDQNKVLAPVLHYKRMLEEMFDATSKDSQYKRQIPLSFSIMNDGNSIYGGVSGWISFDFAVVDVLWVDKNFRKKGLGKLLLKKVESAAKAQNCGRIFTSTNSYSDSLDFWLHQGFELINTVEGKIQVYYLMKKLDA